MRKLRKLSSLQPSVAETEDKVRGDKAMGSKSPQPENGDNPDTGEVVTKMQWNNIKHMKDTVYLTHNTAELSFSCLSFLH